MNASYIEFDISVWNIQLFLLSYQVIPDSPLELVGLVIRLHGGVVSDHLDDQVTHIVFDEE